MPRVECRITCGLGSGVNADDVGKDIANAIKSLTGQQCQVIVNRRDKPISRLNVFRMTQARKNQIELMPPRK